jgi:acyl carrier protein
MDKSIENRVIELVTQVLRRKEGEVTLQSRFVEDLEANSLDVVELTCLAEEEFGVRIAEAQLPSIRTVSDVVRVINELRQQ